MQLVVFALPNRIFYEGSKENQKEIQKKLDEVFEVDLKIISTDSKKIVKNKKGKMRVMCS